MFLVPFPAPNFHSARAQAYVHDRNIVPSRQVRGRHNHSRTTVQRPSATDSDCLDVIACEAVPFQNHPYSLFDVSDSSGDIGRRERSLVFYVQVAILGAADRDGAFGAANVHSDQYLLVHGQ